MTTAFLVLLGIVLVSSVAFGLLLFRLSLEDADFWLKVFSGLLAALIFAIGLAALVTGHFAGQVQAEKVLTLGKDLAIAKKEQADSERLLRELTERQSKQEQPRWPSVLLIDRLLNKPTGTVEILYADNDDAFLTARIIWSELITVGWTVSRIVPISEDDPSQILLKLETPDVPLLMRVGGQKGIVLLANRLPSGGPFDGKTPISALALAMLESKVDFTLAEAKTFPDDFIRIVVGPK